MMDMKLLRQEELSLLRLFSITEEVSDVSGTGKPIAGKITLLCLPVTSCVSLHLNSIYELSACISLPSKYRLNILKKGVVVHVGL